MLLADLYVRHQKRDRLRIHEKVACRVKAGDVKPKAMDQIHLPALE